MAFTILSLVCSVIGITSVFIPLSPIITVPAASYVTFNSAKDGWDSVNDLNNKWNHGRPLNDFESALQILKVVGVPLNIITGVQMTFWDDKITTASGKLKFITEILNNAIDIGDFANEAQEIRYKHKIYKLCKETTPYANCHKILINSIKFV